MKKLGFCLIFASSTTLLSPINGQVPGTSAATTSGSSSGITLSTVGAAVAGGSSFTSILLTGTVLRDPGAPAQTAEPISLTVYADGKTEMKISGATGTIDEVRTGPSHFQACTSTRDTNTPAISTSNCWTSASWVLPTIALVDTAIAAKLVSAFTTVTENGSPTLQLTLHTDTTGRSPGGARFISTITRRTIDLDPQTLLPRSMVYSEHPGNNTFVNIPVAISYSDYRAVDGVTVPFHIVKSTGSVPILDVTISQVTVAK